VIYPDYWVVVWNPKTPRRAPVVRMVFDGGQMKYGHETHGLQEWIASGYVVRRLILPKASLPKKAW